ncbi:hypothetical protein PIB30_045682 [Stylosanthes scabra]|uniref:FAF domain-containing protein n=1 Tax=Stylosanthes scabra TaxID=79078 RepID=A0ABU6SHS1_9FABA|nr:hypothetical protein [Stylosanthes scabra]
MSSIRVCEGLQSCLEPRVIEPRVLRLKLAPAEQQEQEPEKKDWSFLEALSHLPSCNNNNNNKQKHNKDEKEYVHPTLKGSSSMLTPNSLEMCTESLGSETGSLFSHNNHNQTKSESSSTATSTLIKHTIRTPNKARSFPPPLTSITHHGGPLRVMSHRQDGRLVLEAVASPPETATYFHAERTHGRLRLGLCLYHDSEEENDEEEDEEEGVVRQFGRAISNGRCMEGFGADYSFFDLIRTSIA